MKLQTFTIKFKDNTSIEVQTKKTYEESPCPCKDQASGLSYWSIANHRFPSENVLAIVQSSSVEVTE